MSFTNKEPEGRGVTVLAALIIVGILFFIGAIIADYIIEKITNDKQINNTELSISQED